MKDVEYNFAQLMPIHGDEKPVMGKINQGLYDFYKNVADPLCSQLLKGLHQTVSLTIADSFM